MEQCSNYLHAKTKDGIVNRCAQLKIPITADNSCEMFTAKGSMTPKQAAKLRAQSRKETAKSKFAHESMSDHEKAVVFTPDEIEMIDDGGEG